MTQNDAILKDLEMGRLVSALSALEDHNCFRLAARIADLKRAGYPINKDMVRDRISGKRYAVYWLAKGRKAA